MDSEGLYQAIFERAIDTIIIADDETRIVAVNPAAESLLGRAAGELRTLRVPDIVRLPPESTQRLWSRLREDGSQRGELDIVRPDGTTIPVEYAAFAAPVAGYHVSFLRDVSVRRAEDEARDRLLATVSHELRNPLNAILGWAELLMEDASDRVRDGLARILRNARAQAMLVDDLLDVARIARGELRLSLSAVDPAALVRRAVENAQRAASDRELSVTVGPSVRAIIADPERLEQIVGNLLSNAIKFSAPGDRIAVRVARDERETVIEIEDDGQGIAPELLPHLFMPFRRGDASTTRRQGGLGLGLSIVFHLVTLHGGSITAHSEGPRRGARFTVRLADAPHGAVLVGEPDHQPPDRERLRGVRILLCEDDEDSRSALSRALERYGARVVATGSVNEALVALRPLAFDVVVTDITMPQQDGYDLARAIAERGRTPVIAVTARAGEEEASRALAAGFAAHVPKPVHLGELVEEIYGAVHSD